MKYAALLWTAALLCVGFGPILLIGCTQEARDSYDRRANKEPREVATYRDSEVGCEYVGTNGRNLSPRMGADGKQICRAAP